MPMLLKGKRILLGICGGVAACKSLALLRLLMKEGAEARCVCTPAALQFVTPLSIEALSGYPLFHDLFAPRDLPATAHVGLSDWADYLIVAPATANTLAKFAHGIADNALTTLFNAFDKRTLAVPAMNTRMFRNPATQANLQLLRSRGVEVMPPGEGFLACGAQGEGRMPEPEEILRHFLSLSFAKEDAFFKGKHVLLTAGPTRERIDPVRFLSNRSTGKMGSRIADELQQRGALVHFVCGPLQACPKGRPFETVAVESAREMYQACLERWPEMDMGILSAAVADYAPKEISPVKIKKAGGGFPMELERTPDILLELGREKRAGQLLAGFALETDHELENAREKLRRKNADLLVLNSLRDPGAGFAVETNRVCFLDREGGVDDRPIASKEEVAAWILDKLAGMGTSGALKS